MFAQFTQGAADMDRGEAGGIGDIGLAQAEGQALTLHPMGGGHAGIEFAQEIRHPRQRAHGAVAHHPMAVDGGIDQGHQPKFPGHLNIAIEQLAQRLMRDDGDMGIGQRYHIMVELLQREGVQIDKRTGELEGDEGAAGTLSARHAAGDQPI